VTLNRSQSYNATTQVYWFSIWFTGIMITKDSADKCLPPNPILNHMNRESIANSHRLFI